jgi:hypothetical protein
MYGHGNNNNYICRQLFVLYSVNEIGTVNQKMFGSSGTDAEIITLLDSNWKSKVRLVRGNNAMT